MTDEIEYFENKRSDKTYISRRISNLHPNGTQGRPVRIASKVFDPTEDRSYAKELDELVIRVSPGQREQLVAKFYEDNKEIVALTFQKFTRSSGRPQQTSFSFYGEELRKLLSFLSSIREFHFRDEQKVNVTDRELERLLSEGQLSKLLIENFDAVQQLLHSQITKSDLISLGYRKQQLAYFRRLLFEDGFFDSERANLGIGEEAAWQKFFETNKWIFGYGLTYLFLSNLDEKKLEQIVVGSDISGRGKRADALLKSRGAISALCFVEIKKHSTDLLKSDPYRPACWAPSDDLAGGVAQTQVTVEMTKRKISEKFEPADRNGQPSGEEIFSYHPRSILVIGSLAQFQSSTGVNQKKYRSFELYRRHMHRPEIFTFDELYERAKFIVDNSES
jgi:hypothetical protein